MGKPIGQVEVIKRQLAAKFGQTSSPALNRIDQLSAEQLEALSVALLSFGQLADFEQWLQVH